MVFGIVAGSKPRGRIAMPAEVVELRSEAEYREAFPVIRELHGGLEERRYLELLGEMIPAGYRLFAIRGSSGEIVAVAGVQVLTNLYYERHLYVYDLVATEDARSEGHDRSASGPCASTSAGDSRGRATRCARPCSLPLAEERYPRHRQHDQDYK
jgi:hypothetical protein